MFLDQSTPGAHRKKISSVNTPAKFAESESSDSDAGDDQLLKPRGKLYIFGHLSLSSTCAARVDGSAEYWQHVLHEFGTSGVV